MRFFLDTNVVSELRKIRLGKANVYVRRWAESTDAADLLAEGNAAAFMTKVALQTQDLR